MGSQKTLEESNGIFLECVHCKNVIGCKFVKEKDKEGCLFLEERKDKEGWKERDITGSN